ncbi:YeeE/YedE family protein [Ottowia sp.]|uniref:YeeE/YedE family protein n=1 Tax=Ottowia sp. TaxID=1898956 RepID=UPI003A8C1FFB
MNQIQQTTDLILGWSFALSAVLGVLMQRTRFCAMGALADVMTTGSTLRLRQWALAAGVAVLGFGVLAASGWVRVADSMYAASRWAWLSALVGGGLFGVGMVLASGCGAKTLVRMGSGSLKALVVFLVMGLATYATLRGITGVLRASTVDRVFVEFSGPAIAGQWLSAAGGWTLPQGLMGAALLAGVPMLGWALMGKGFINADNLWAGLGVGAVVVGMWWVSGVLAYVSEHPETLEPAYLATRTGRIEMLTFTAPLAYSLEWLLLFSDRSLHLGVGVASVLGMVVGAALSALWRREFRWEGFATTQELVHHLLGGALMGVGGVTALGCTVGQGLSGLSTLSLTSLTAVAGIVGGAVLALQYQYRKLERAA